MKKAIMIVCAAVFGFLLAGCGSLREEQNPQPKMNAPCDEWLELSKKQTQQDKASIKKTDTKKDKSTKKGKKGKKSRKGKKSKKNESK